MVNSGQVTSSPGRARSETDRCLPLFFFFKREVEMSELFGTCGYTFPHSCHLELIFKKRFNRPFRLQSLPRSSDWSLASYRIF